MTIAQGKEVWSEPIDFAVPNQGNITITTAFGSVPSQVVGHSGSRTTSYLASGSNVTAASMTSATAFQHWYYISGIDVMADASAKGVVAIGDSITDGRGTDNDKNNRWTDILAARLQANAATKNVAMMNQGIGATNLVGTSGTAAQARFARDVLGQSGVKYAIVFDGVNDIAGGASFTSMKAAYDGMMSAAHAKGVLIYGATITPFGGDASFTARQMRAFASRSTRTSRAGRSTALSISMPRSRMAEILLSCRRPTPRGPRGIQRGAQMDCTRGPRAIRRWETRST